MSYFDYVERIKNARLKYTLYAYYGYTQCLADLIMQDVSNRKMSIENADELLEIINVNTLLKVRENVLYETEKSN